MAIVENDGSDDTTAAAAPDTTLAYDAWVLLANGAYRDHTDAENCLAWLAARDRWRDRFHATLHASEERPWLA